ncbi:hemolysin family protein [Branchiibius sp. NY16-3462-2]|uniref:hemolysin family protein n=1 Tax=Branchiibius sp. NY16-3462-2 TaxID=1807500 RepID=UPI000799D576|nr:hemolysin family protein [Branchiibius sp. NY16-3462-2]KYH43712.1 hypothetical protein AZH51_02615 [Branchiibius sp. NY16-3462-2]
MTLLLGLLSVLLLTLATAYFVLQEFAYVAVDRGGLAQLADEGDAAASRALQVTSRLSFTLSGAQLGITVTALLVGYVSEPYLGAGLAELLTGVTGIPAALSLSISVVLALILSTVIQMVIGELAPKNYAIARPVDLARALSRSTLIYLAAAGPVIRLFDSASTRLLRAVGIEPVEELPQGATPEDLRHIIDESQAGGLLDRDLSELLDRGLEFRERTADEVMTPRVDVVLVAAADTIAEVVHRMGSGHSRFPVVDESVDDVLGVIGIHQVLAVPVAERATRHAREVAIEVVRVPDSLPVPEVLERLRAAHQQLAVVIDEYGGFAGIVSLEDIVEEVVGDIEDESDRGLRGPRTPVARGWRMSARLRLDEVEDETGVALPESEHYDTVSGLVLARLGRTATAGDEVILEWRPDQESAVRHVSLVVEEARRHVPRIIRLTDLGPIEQEVNR